MLTAAVFACGALLGANALACSFPPGDYSVSSDIPDRIPARGALPVVFHGTHDSITPPPEDPNVTFEVLNSNDKPIPGDYEVYLVGADHSHPWGSLYDYLVAWTATDGWTPGETYTLTIGTTPPYVDPETLEHSFTAVDTSGDVAAPTVSSVSLSVSEDRAASDCCVPDEDVNDTCTGRPIETCWTTEFEYTPHIHVSVAPVADDLWVSQTLYGIAGNHPDRPLKRPTAGVETPLSLSYGMHNESFCLKPMAIRIGDGTQFPAAEQCRGQEDLPDYTEREASEYVGVPEECQDQTDADAGDEGGSDAGDDADAGGNGDAGTDGSSNPDQDGSSSADGDGANDLGSTSEGCGCSQSPERAPVPSILLMMWLVGLAYRRSR